MRGAGVLIARDRYAVGGIRVLLGAAVCMYPLPSPPFTADALESRTSGAMHGSK